jgi:hypothetical protein
MIVGQTCFKSAKMENGPQRATVLSGFSVSAVTSLAMEVAICLLCTDDVGLPMPAAMIAYYIKKFMPSLCQKTNRPKSYF